MSEKLPCPQCERKFVDNFALRQHQAAKHGGKVPGRGSRRAYKQSRPAPIPGMRGVDKEAAFLVWQDVTSDMSDGTAFAMLEQFGLTMDDVIVEAERQNRAMSTDPT